MRASSPVQRWFREPLLQFVLIGLALFGVQRWLHPDASAVTLANRIEVTQDDLRQMSVTWLAQGRPPLTAEEWRNLIDAKVREEVLYREALAAGLDQGDTIVKRRMVQKMEFLAEDVAAAHEPTDAELKSWFDDNQARFAVPPRITFRHLYFGFDQRGERAKGDAQSALTAIDKLPDNAKVALAMGDPFMFQDVYRDRIPDHIAKEFGPPFARALFQLAPGAWRGPIESGYGWHLIFVESLEPERPAAYEEVEPDVRMQWIAEQSERAKRKAYEQMRSKYIVVLPEPPQ